MPPAIQQVWRVSTSGPGSLCRVARSIPAGAAGGVIKLSSIACYRTASPFQEIRKYTFSGNAHGGGYDDVAFIGGAAYVSASNPSTDNGAKNPGASVVKAVLHEADHTVVVSPEMVGTPQAKDVATGKTSSLNLTDPNSLAVSPAGDLILDSQGDGELLWMKPGAKQGGIKVLSLLGGVQVDDTTFATSETGFLLFADTKADTVYKLTAPVWHVGMAFSACNGVDASASPPTPAVPAYVGQLDLHTGALLPIAEHLASPHGMIFVPTRG